jgi:hypothetical protein
MCPLCCRRCVRPAASLGIPLQARYSHAQVVVGAGTVGVRFDCKLGRSLCLRQTIEQQEHPAQVAIRGRVFRISCNDFPESINILANMACARTFFGLMPRAFRQKTAAPSGSLALTCFHNLPNVVTPSAQNVRLRAWGAEPALGPDPRVSGAFWIRGV